MNLSCRRLFINALLIGSAYYAGALVGFALTFSDDFVSTLWPPNAMLLAVLLLTSTRSLQFEGVPPEKIVVDDRSRCTARSFCRANSEQRAASDDLLLVHQ